MTKQSKGKKSADKLSLIGKVCLLEGSSRSKINTYVTVLKALGATISQSFGDHLTHYIIVSQQSHHLYPKRLLAAQLLDIKTVQVAWVDRCKELNQHVSEIDYELPIPLAFIESYLRKTKNITSINLSDGTKSTSDAIGLPIYNEDEELKTTTTALTTNRMKRGNTSSTTTTTTNTTVIPLPTFREFVPPVIPPNAAITMVKRRSERISDLNSDDGHYLDDLFDYKTVSSDIEVNKANNNKMQELSLEVVLNIPVDLPLPVLYEDASHSGDDRYTSSAKDKPEVNDTTVMNDLTHHHHHPDVKQCISTTTTSTIINNTTKKTSNASNNNKRKVDVTTINDNNNNYLKRACRSNITISNTTTDIITNKVPAQQLAVAVRSLSKSKVVVDSMKGTSTSTKIQQPQFVPAIRCVWKATMVIALTGFIDSNGEKSTITSTLKQLIKTIKKKVTNNSKPNFVPNNNNNNNNSSRNSKNKIPVINPLETSVLMVADSEDFSTYSCNIVIASKKSQTRSLRILFALANGLLIVTEEWVYQSVSQEAWADPLLYPHPRFSGTNSQRIHTSILTNPEPIHTFKNNKICVLNSTDPTLDVLISLVHSSGGTTTKDIIPVAADCDGLSYVLFGNQTDANTWVANSMKNCLHSEESIEYLKHLSKCNKVVTCKFLFNCIEARKIHQPTAKDEELISLESLLATYHHVNNNNTKDCGSNDLRSVKTKPGKLLRTTKISNNTDQHEATSQTVYGGNKNSKSSYSKRCKDTMHSLQSQTKQQQQQQQHGHSGNVSQMLEKKDNSLAGVTPYDWVKTNHHTAPHILGNLSGEHYEPSPIVALHTASPIDMQLTGYTTTAAITNTEKLVTIDNSTSDSEEEEETTLLDGSVLLNDMASVHRTTNTQLAASSLLSLLQSTSKQQQQQLQDTNTSKPASTAISHAILATNSNSTARNHVTTAINTSRNASTNPKSKHPITNTTTATVAPVIVSDFIDPYASYNNNTTKNNKKNITTTNNKKKKHNDEVEHVRNKTKSSSSSSSSSSILKQKQGSNVAMLYDCNTNSDDETNDSLLDESKYNEPTTIITTNSNATSSLTKQTTNKTLTSNLHIDIPNPTLHTAAAVTILNQNSNGKSSGRLIKNKKSISYSSSILKSNNDNNKDKEKDSDDEIQFTPSQVTPVAIATGRVPRSEDY